MTTTQFSRTYGPRDSMIQFEHFGVGNDRFIFYVLMLFMILAYFPNISPMILFCTARESVFSTGVLQYWNTVQALP